MKKLNIGDVVVYTDEHAKEHAALITAIHGTFHESDVWTQEDVDEQNASYKAQFPEGTATYDGLLGTTHSVPSLNLVHVSSDASQHDQYGTQIVRPTSVVHNANQTARGRFWDYLDV